MDEKDRVVVPSQLTETFLKFFHHTLRPPGHNAFYLTLKCYYKVFDVKRQIAFVNDSCYHCQTNKKLLSKYGLMNGSLSSDRPLEHVSTDILGPFKNSLFRGLLDGGKFWILTMIDLYSRWTELAVLTTISGYSVTDAFHRTWSRKHGYPHRGTQFISVDFQDYCTANRILHIMPSLYNATSNGVSERINPTITLWLRMHKNRPISEVLNIANC